MFFECLFLDCYLGCVSMFGIVYMGNYKDEEQLIRGRSLPEGSIQFREGVSLNEIFLKSFVIMLPIVLVMVIISLKRCSQLNRKMSVDIYFLIVLIITSIICWILRYVHEIIHAILYSRNAEKTIWKDVKQGIIFLYCNESVSKTRFIIINVAPSIILGIIPFVIWIFVIPYIDIKVGIGWLLISWYMTVFSMGDYFNIYNAIKQVPKDAIIFNYGMHSYWRRNMPTGNENL